MGIPKRILPKVSYMNVCATAAGQTLKGMFLSEDGEMLFEYSYALPWTGNLANDTRSVMAIALDAISNGPSSTGTKAKAYNTALQEWLVDPNSFTYQLSTAANIVWNAGARLGEKCTTASLSLIDWDYMGDFGA